MIDWIKKYWFVPVAAVGATVLWFLRISKESPVDAARFHAELGRAKADAEKNRIEQGSAAALEILEAKHKNEIEEFKKTNNESYHYLVSNGDPSDLAEAALRAGRRARRRRTGG